MQPLADRIRPLTIDEFFGQDHLVGDAGILRENLNRSFIPSMLLWGPPGVGKTTLAGIIIRTLNRPHYSLSAVDSGVKQVREVIAKAEKNRILDSGSPLLFIDEIHRFSKSQQDALLKAVEKGTVTLIGATTENPSFEVISPLLSRMQVYQMMPLSDEDLKNIIDRAIERDMEYKNLDIREIDYDSLIHFGGGDARKTLNLLELVLRRFSRDKEVIIDESLIHEVARANPLNYDKKGDEHYDLISAFIKSIRGGDPDATLYWMARMLAGGEDPLFICRRMIIAASEDIGLANPNALLMANTCFQSVHQIGMPEARIPMAQTAIYLATSPKSNSAYNAINKAMKEVKQSRALPVTLHLRNAPTPLMKELNHGKNYKYPHDFENNFIKQPYLPEELMDVKFYHPQNNPQEARLKERLKKWWKDNIR